MTHGLIRHFDQHGKTNGGVQISFWNMETKTFHHQRETDHHQKCQTQNNHGRVFIDKFHQWLGSPQHDSDRDNDGNHHHRQMFDHAHRSNHTI